MIMLMSLRVFRFWDPETTAERRMEKQTPSRRVKGTNSMETELKRRL